MKKNRILKAFVICLLSAAMLSACGTPHNSGVTETSQDTSDASSGGTDTSEPEETIHYETLRPVAEGDVYAINKFIVDPLPEAFNQAAKTQEKQGLLFLAKNSQIVVAAANYKEDLTDLASFAENACATIALNYMMEWCDLDFSDPVKTKIAGFDAIYYDYTLTQNDFVKENPNDEGDGVKTPIAWYKARVYYFYSDKDAFYFTFTTKADDWDTTVKDCEAFAAAVKIDENAVNEPAKTAQ